jgi:hypothetical protein
LINKHRSQQSHPYSLSQARDPIRETGRVISKANYLQLWINKIPNALMNKHRRQQSNPYYRVKLEIPSEKQEESFQRQTTFSSESTIFS